MTIKKKLLTLFALSLSIYFSVTFYQHNQTFNYVTEINNNTTQEIINNVTVIVEVDGEQYEAKTNDKGLAEFSINKKFKGKAAQVKIEDQKGFVQYEQEVELKTNSDKKEQTPTTIPIPPLKNFVIPPVSEPMVAGDHKDVVFQGQKNTPLLIEVRGFGQLRYHLEVLNLDEEVLYKSNNYRASNQFHQIPFTPIQDGRYIIRVQGHQNKGSYWLHLSVIDEENRPPNQTLMLTDGEKQIDRLGQGAYDDYKFKGFFNTPIMLQTRTNDYFKYKVVVLNEAEEVLWESNEYRTTNTYNNNPFTPSENGQYILRIIGNSSFGTYWVKYYTIDQPSVQDIVIGKRYENTLAAGAYDDYQLKGNANIPLVIKTMGKQGGYLRYMVMVLDQGGAEIIRTNEFRASNQYTETLFTPVHEGTYTIRVWGNSKFGKYWLLVDEVY